MTFTISFRNTGCNMQFGGDDQWSNMLGGTELIRRKLGKDAYAMTITLLTDSQGNKMGKTAATLFGWTRTKPRPMNFTNTGAMSPTTTCSNVSVC